jgi:hypothetical protein
VLVDRSAPLKMLEETLCNEHRQGQQGTLDQLAGSPARL